MRAVIIGNGDIKDYEYIKRKINDNDFIICADGGYNHAVKLGLTPDIVIGDFDSAHDIENASNRIKYPVRKDYTDGELAVTYAAEHGFDDIMITGFIGDRMDHTITDILLLAKCVNGVIVDDNNEIYLLRSKLKIKGRIGQTISIIPINGDAEGLCTSGLEYPLDNETLYFGQSRGVSNVMTENECEIRIGKGIALVIKVEKV